jgi:thiamine biosynthesis lipoprotein
VKIRIAPLLLSFLCVFPACKHASAPVTRQTTAMDTYLSITVYDDIAPGIVDAAIDSAIAEINHVERIATDYSDSSEIGRANAGAGQDSVVVSDELASLLHTSLAFGDSTGGAFDITVGPLERLWDILALHPRVPPPDSVELVHRLVDYGRVSLHGNVLFLPLRGMKIDLGAIGKGYAVDRAAAALARAGIRRTIVDLGGNLVVRWDGTHGLDSAIATISVRHPRKEGAYLGTFRCGSAGVATSGDYERYFMAGGIRYHHIMDPATGYPARGVVSTTIVAPTGTEADAVSTIVFILGREKGMAFLRQRSGVEGFIVYEQGDSLAIDYSPGFAGKFALGESRD